MTLSALMKTRNGATFTATKIGTATTNPPMGVALKVFQFEAPNAVRERDTDKAALQKLMFQECGDSFWECVIE